MMVLGAIFIGNKAFKMLTTLSTNPNKRFGRVICSSRWFDPPGENYSWEERKKIYQPTKDLMRDLLEIVWSELEVLILKKRHFNETKMLLFEVIKYPMPGGDVNKFETLVYQCCFTTARFKHWNSDVTIALLLKIFKRRIEQTLDKAKKKGEEHNVWKWFSFWAD